MKEDAAKEIAILCEEYSSAEGFVSLSEEENRWIAGIKFHHALERKFYF